MSDDERTPTVLERLTRAGVTEEAARAHMAAGRIKVGGVLVTDPDQPDDSEAGPGIHLDPA